MSITIALGAVVMLLLFSSCEGGRKKLGDAITERDSLPIMATYGVTNLVSDSGVLRYRIKSEEWLMYDRKNPSYWAFEKGVYLEQFDSLLHVSASIKADTAYYYDRQKLWKLMGNVDIKNLKGERITTELMFWNQITQKVYSDRYIRIEQPQYERTIFGYGFESDQQMNAPRILNVAGIFYFDEDAEKKDSLQIDTIRQ